MTQEILSNTDLEKCLGKMSLAESADDTQVYAQQIKELEAAGFQAKPKFIKLIKKTRGNVELVIKFLEAKQNMHDAMKQHKEHKSCKRDEKERKLLAKIEKISQKANKKSCKYEEKRKVSKEDKEQAKLEKKEQKDLAKLEKKEEKERSKLDKKQAKFEKKAEKKSAKLEKIQMSSQMNSDEIPIECSNIYLDGNNMLFVLAPFRSHSIRGGLAKAAEMLQVMGKAYSAVRPELEKLTIIFDNSKISVDEENFKVVTARPAYKTSDDALVDWFEKMDKSQIAKSCVVTSDRGLIERLKQLGVQVYGPRTWFREARYMLSDNVDATQGQQDLDAWAAQWLNETMKD